MTTTTVTRLDRITDEDVEACRTAEALIRALAITGRLNADGSEVICPVCNQTTSVGKFKFHPDGGFKHFSSGSCWGGKGFAIDLLQATLDLDFVDSVRALVGKATRKPVTVPDSIPDLDVRSFTAIPDPEVLAGVLTYGRKYNGGECVRAAQSFYGQWHISPDVVEASGAVCITNPAHFAHAIQQRYSLDRLVACGLFVINKRDEPMCLVGTKWPVVEPGKDAAGSVTNLQFRASNEQYARYLRHKAGELEYEGNQKFVNLRGVPTDMYLGCGLDEVATLTTPSDVFWVEGFKDRLAATTMGVRAYGIPGVSYRPPAAVIETMRPHRVVLSLDGDEAGASGMFGLRTTDADGNEVISRPGLADRLTSAGLTVSVKRLRDGLDITDSLVLTHAQNGCGCPACTDMRARLGI